MSLLSTYPGSLSAGIIVGDPAGTLVIPAAATKVVILTVMETTAPTVQTCDLDDGVNPVFPGTRHHVQYGGQLEFTFFEWDEAQLTAMANRSPTISYDDNTSVASREWCAFFLDGLGDFVELIGVDSTDGVARQDLLASGGVDAKDGGFAIGVYQSISKNRDLDDTTPLLGDMDTLLADTETSASSLGLGTASLSAGPYSLGMRCDASTNVSMGFVGVMWDPDVVTAAITDVDGDDVIRDGQANVAINGTAIPAGVDGVQIAGVQQAGFTRVSSTLCRFTAALDQNQLGTDLTLQLTIGGVPQAGLTRTIQFESAFQGFVNPATPFEADTTKRLTASPVFANGDQVEWRVTGGSGTVEIRTDLSFRAQTSVTAFQARCHDGTEWGPWSTQTLT